MIYPVDSVIHFSNNRAQEFSDIQGDSAEVEQPTDPAIVAYIKGEIPVPGVDCQQTVAKEKCESHNLKKTTREKTSNKAHRVKKHTPTCQKRRVVGSKPDLRMKPPPVEELVLRRRRSQFISTEKVSQSSAKPSRRESPDKKIFGCEPHIHDSHEKCIQESATRDSMSQIGAERITRPRLRGILLVVAMINALLRVVEKLCAYVHREWAKFNDIYVLEGADVQYTEPAFIAHVKGEDTAAQIS